jgi:hypothetical protein
MLAEDGLLCGDSRKKERKRVSEKEAQGKSGGEGTGRKYDQRSCSPF